MGALCIDTPDRIPHSPDGEDVTPGSIAHRARLKSGTGSKKQTPKNERRSQTEVRHRTNSILDQRENVVAFELLAAVQELELDHEGKADHLAAQLLDKVDLGPGGAAGREQVVVDEHAGTALDRVGVELERVEPILQRILRAHR